MIEIHNFTQNEIDEKLFQKTAEVVLKNLGIKNETEISLAIVGSGRMRRLNKMYRKKNRVTDVLSFPSFVHEVARGDRVVTKPRTRRSEAKAGESIVQYLAKSFPRLERREDMEFIEPPNGVKRLGEIVICYPEAKKQVKRAGHSLEKELAILLIHGILHLTGYEHEKGGKEEKEMKEIEERILKNI